MAQNTRIKPHLIKLAGFDLFIGRKWQHIKDEAQLVFENDYTDLYYGGLTVLTSQHCKLMVNNKLFATVRLLPKRRYRRSPVKVVKLKDGSLQVWLVKKYVTLH